MNDTDASGRGTGLLTQTFIGLALVAVIAVIGALILRANSFEDVEQIPLPGAEGTGAVRGVCVDDEGMPMAGVQLQWGASMGSTGGLFGGGVYASTERTVTSAGDGTFELRGLPLGQGYLDVRWDESPGAGSGPPREGSSKIIQVEEGNCASGFEVVVRVIPPERILAGKVVDAGGAPRSFVLVEANYEGTFRQWRSNKSTAADGSFRFISPYAKGPFTVTWERSDGTEGEIEVSAPGPRNLVLGDR